MATINLQAGTIPAELGNLSNLEWLWLNGNQLTGGIPSELGSLANLQELDIGYNQLTGTIPSELGDLSELGIYSGFVTTNSQEQYLLNSATCPILRNLRLNDNQLTGTIPV